MIWGYIASAVCVSCPGQETIDHCFLNCATVKVVLFVPIVKSVSGSWFVVDPPCFFFFVGPRLRTRRRGWLVLLPRPFLMAFWFN